MTPEQALLAAIFAAPNDDLPRLVFADHLDETGRPEWAEFIRVQVEAAKGLDPRSCPVCSGAWARAENCDQADPDLTGARFFCDEGHLWFPDRITSLPRLELAAWESLPHDHFAYLDSAVMRGRGTVGHGWLSADTSGVVVHRGFVAEVGFRMDDWRAGVVAEVVAENPVELLVAIDRVPDPIGDRFCWVRDRPRLPESAATLPVEVFKKLLGGEYEATGEDWQDGFGVNDEWMIYPDMATAVVAVSAAFLAAAREPRNPKADFAPTTISS